MGRPRPVRRQIENAEDEFESYAVLHPRSAAAVRRPRLIRRRQNWIALLGADLQTGIYGIGHSVHGALRAFDAHYHHSLQPPASWAVK
jgi:hypothetical protein